MLCLLKVPCLSLMTSTVVVIICLQQFLAVDSETEFQKVAPNQDIDTQGSRRRPLRPTLSISDRILPIQLVDTTDGYLRVPKRKHLRVQTLMATLDQDFDPKWMAVEKPHVLIEEPTPESVGSFNNKKLLAEVKFFNLSTEIHGAGDHAIKMFEEWLVKKATCPIRYIWDDVGPLFWPRWIKRGECVNVAGRACSWPFGMNCVPAESLTVHLLRWHCRPRSRRATSRMPSMGRNMQAASKPRHDHKQYRCQWLKVPYPVTAECFCSC